MSLAQVATTLTVENLISLAMERSAATDTPAALIARAVVQNEYENVSEEARFELMARGLAAEINTRNGRARWLDGIDENESDSEPRRIPGVPRLVHANSLLWETRYQGADGRIHSWMEMTDRDLAHIDLLMSMRENGIKAVRKRVKLTRSLLAQHKVEHVYELPDDAISEIEDVR